MPARDIYHDQVKNALIKDGWTITDDPLQLTWGRKDMYVDLGVEQLLGAEKSKRKIAVEIKSFVSKSSVSDLHDAIGQFVMYRAVLEETEPDRILFLAVRDVTYEAVFEDSVGLLMLSKQLVQLIVFNANRQEIVRWVP